MKALVTGDRGFVGRHFVEYLKEGGWEVYGMDIVDGDDVMDFFKDPDDDYFDLVVHAAYEVGGRSHIDGRNMALAHNVAMDAAMFDWALKTHQGAVLYFSSSAAYPIRHQTVAWIVTNPLRHEDEIDLDNPLAADANYGWAKLTGEKIAKAASDGGLRVHVVRPFSGYGSDQSLDYPFPSIIKRAGRGDLTVWGPPGQTRDWIHIHDVVGAAYSVYEHDERRPVNICTGIGTEMGSLMRTAHNISAHGCAWQLAAFVDCGCFDITYLEDKPTGVFYRVGDPTRMNEHYVPQISIEEGVKRAIAQSS